MQRQQQTQQNVQMELTVENHWYNVFNRYDVDGDGRIALSELKTMLSSSHFNHDIPDRVVTQIIKNADADKNGFLDFNEFLRLVESDEGKRLFSRYINSYVRTVIPRRTWTRHDIIDGEYEDQYTCSPPALGLLIISIIEIAFFLYDVAVTHTLMSTNGPVARFFIYDPHKRIELWRFVTYMFVHIGVVHLIVNIMVQVLLGIPLEMVHRWWRVLVVYFAGVIAGSLATSISDPYVYLAGASGGVYALITAHIATIIMNWSEMQFAVWQLLVFLVLAVVDIGSAVHARYIANIDQKIGYVAHIAGAAAGLLVGLYVLRNLEVQSWERTLWRISILVFAALVAVGIVWNIAYPSYFPEQRPTM
ncbi:rhomboid-related protein 2 [Homalodisca vitripennis]|uniref:rhomboid-related protein 2 n=1 Tax=Homalodisca vitripennis TaxID=197043 RepID=UPI001EEB1A28|nr:rhomboid-related protein 2 [Homalodisca vitripennis]